MAKKLSASDAVLPEHVIHRGNNRQAVFCNKQDMKAYVMWLKQYTKLLARI